MAAATDRGQRVVCVSATAGERGTSDPETWPPARLGRVRRWEAAAAMAVVGVAEHRILGLPDGALAEHDDRGLAMVSQLLDEVQPDTILTFGPDGMTFHPDHITVSRWVTEAWRRGGCRGRLLYATSTVDYVTRFAADFEEWGAYMTDDRPTGVPAEELAIHMVLDGAQLDRKLTALASDGIPDPRADGDDRPGGLRHAGRRRGLHRRARIGAGPADGLSWSGRHPRLVE